MVALCQRKEILRPYNPSRVCTYYTRWPVVQTSDIVSATLGYCHDALSSRVAREQASPAGTAKSAIFSLPLSATDAFVFEFASDAQLIILEEASEACPVAR